MPSNRRVKLLALLVFIFIISILFYSSSFRQSSSDLDSSSEFYSKTVNALKDAGNSGAKTQQKLGNSIHDGDEIEEDDAGVRERLKAAADEAKGKANAKSPKPDPPSSLIGKGNAREGNVAGRKTYPLKPKDGETQRPVEETKVETEEEHAIEVEMNQILKKSPIIVFSKSYCPHSKRAKDILLGKYVIDPAPYVVELDQHPMGSQLQASLADMTGRRTVPNVLINGKSIGGGDEVSGLDRDGKLVDMVRTMGGKRMLEVKKIDEIGAEKTVQEANEKGSEKGPGAATSPEKEHDNGLKRRRRALS